MPKLDRVQKARIKEIEHFISILILPPYDRSFTCQAWVSGLRGRIQDIKRPNA